MDRNEGRKAEPTEDVREPVRVAAVRGSVVTLHVRGAIVPTDFVTADLFAPAVFRIDPRSCRRSYTHQ